MFQLFVYWLYNQRFPTDVRDQYGELIKKWMHGANIKVDLFVYLYIISDKYSVKELGAETVDTAFGIIRDQQTCQLPSTAAIRKAFDSLDLESPMCHFLVRAWVFWTPSNAFNILEDNKCLPFIRMTMKYLMEKVHEGRLTGVALCEFHRHEAILEDSTCKGKGCRWTAVDRNRKAFN